MEYPLLSKTYHDALKQNKLMGLACVQCGIMSATPRMACPKCGAAGMQCVELSGKGRIVTFATVLVAPEGREKEVPYTVVMVEADEGPWVMGNLTGVDATAVSMALIGRRVQMSHEVFPGDRYSAGELVRPLFSLEG